MTQMRIYLKDSMAVSTGDNTARMFRAIAEGLWPFVPQLIELEVDYDIDFNRYRVVADAYFKRKPYYDNLARFAAIVPMDCNSFQGDPEVEMLKAIDNMFLAWRYMRTLPIPSNVVLGEN